LSCINNYKNESFKIYKNINPVIEANSAIFDRYKNTITLLKKMDQLRCIKLLEVKYYLE